MEALSRILLLVERGEPVHLGVAKGLLLARRTGASLDLYLCDTEPYHDFAAGGAGALELVREACLARGEAYLRSLQQCILCSDVPISAEAGCAASLARGLADRIARVSAQIVIRAAAMNATFNFRDWGLLGQVPIPMLMTRGRPWRPAPRFAAIVEAGQSREDAPCARLMDLCLLLGRRCDARVDFVSRTPGDFVNRIAQCDYDLVAVEHPRVSTARGAGEGIGQDLSRATAADMLFVPTVAETPDALLRMAG
jgi:hypothetical protein